MNESEYVVAEDRLRQVRFHATSQLGFLFDPNLIHRIGEFIVEKVKQGEAGGGISHNSLVAGADMPAWVAHRNLLGNVLALVAIDSYEREGFFVTALVCVQSDGQMPTPGFCRFLEDVGLLPTGYAREDCIELWDHHWKMVVSHYDRPSRLMSDYSV